MIGRLAGVSHSPGAKERLRCIPDGTPLDLIAEPENEYDPDAVRVEHEGLKLGYIGAGYVPPGMMRNKDFVKYPEAWPTARLVTNNAGEWRIKIDVAR